MAKRDMVENHVEKLLEQITGNESLARDEDGDWPFGLDRGVMYVGVRGDREAHVQVWGIAAVDVPEGLELFRTLNEVNNVVRFSRAHHRDGEVIIVTELVGESLDLEELQMAVDRVAQAADHFGPKIVEVCGGRTPRERQASTEQATAPAPTGQYL